MIPGTFRSRRAASAVRILRGALLLCGVAAAGVPSSPAAAQDAGERGPKRRAPERVAVLATEFPVARHRVTDVDGDGRADLLAVGDAGEVRVWRHEAGKARIADQPAGVLVLPEPERSMIALADLLGTGRPQLVVLSRQGLAVHPPSPDGGFARAGTVLSAEARLSLRTGTPRFAPFVKDVNGDGRPDVLVPRTEGVDLYLTVPGKDGAPPTLRRAASVRVDVSRERAAEDAALSDVLESSFRIPSLRITDVNGDGRKDLAVEEGKRRSWHLAREDGSIPADPDVKLDLEIYRDTTPEAEVRLGRTLAGSDEQRLETRDLDGDGIPDYVIAHRRKVWVFRAGPAGPQFTEPLQVLRVADDVTAMLLLRLDADERPDLLLLRVQVPTVATLLRGLVAEWDIEVAALGYAGVPEKGFEPTPKWKGNLAFRLPAILGVLRDPDALIRRFEDVSKRFKAGLEGDFDGDGRGDLALADPAKGRIEAWYARRESGAADAEQELASVFFGEDTQVWDLDRLLGWLGSLADQRAARLTGGRDADATIPLRPLHEAEFLDVLAGDLDGEPGEEIVVGYELPDGRAAFEVWR